MSVDRQKRILGVGALFACALALCSCTSSIADLPAVGTPTDAPRAKETGDYLPVNDLPPNRDEAVLDPTERARIRAELLAARDRQAAATPAKDSSAKDNATK